MAREQQFSGHQLSGLDFIYITPDPRFARLDRPDKRMRRGVKVLGSVAVLRRVAATHMPANQAQAEMDPRIAHLCALFAYMFARFSEFDLVEVSAFFRHRTLPSFAVSETDKPYLKNAKNI
jgi:hypothetical protein